MLPGGCGVAGGIPCQRKYFITTEKGESRGQKTNIKCSW